MESSTANRRSRVRFNVSRHALAKAAPMHCCTSPGTLYPRMMVRLSRRPQASRCTANIQSAWPASVTSVRRACRAKGSVHDRPRAPHQASSRNSLRDGARVRSVAHKCQAPSVVYQARFGMRLWRSNGCSDVRSAKSPEHEFQATVWSQRTHRREPLFRPP